MQDEDCCCLFDKISRRWRSAESRCIEQGLERGQELTGVKLPSFSFSISRSLFPYSGFEIRRGNLKWEGDFDFYRGKEERRRDCNGRSESILQRLVGQRLIGDRIFWNHWLNSENYLLYIVLASWLF
jgi:hypothetical protein